MAETDRDPAIRDLEQLFSHLEPALSPDEYVFCSVTTFDAGAVSPWATVREDEGVTVIVTKAQADALGWSYGTVMRRLTLTVHSSLDAVGLTAAVSGALAGEGLSANVVAGYYHDHFFVPADRALEALNAVTRLSQK